jgi:hypothetical protein
MGASESDKRHAIMQGLIPAHWDRSAATLASEIRDFLKNIKDEGTNIDSGGGDGSADLWVTVGGVEYFINIAKSGNQLEKEQKR